MSKVNVYNGNNAIIARVNYNSNLDYWDGRNMTCGSTGRHKGLTRLKNGDFVLIHGTQWQGENDYAEVITDVEALHEILRSENMELLEKYKDLKSLADKQLIEEEE